MEGPAGKRQRLSPSPSEPTPGEMIARLLSDRQASVSRDASHPLIQDLSSLPSTSSSQVPAPVKPSFELPDFSGSESLLARVHSLLPQLKQANTQLDAFDGSGFQLIDKSIEERDDQSGDEDEEELNPELLTRDRPIEDEEERDDAPDPQIVIDLALGVLEHKSGVTEDDESSSDSESSEEDSDSEDDSLGSDESNDAESGLDDSHGDNGQAAEQKPSSNTPLLESRGRRRPLIEELS